MQFLDQRSGLIPQEIFNDVIQQIREITKWMRTARGVTELGDKVVEIDAFMTHISKRVSEDMETLIAQPSVEKVALDQQ